MADAVTATHAHLGGRVMIGCSACIDAVRAAEEIARWETAPRHRVTWHCAYTIDSMVHTLTFRMIVRVPPGATGELDNHYADLTGEQFVLALPDTIAMADTDRACQTMCVTAVVVGEKIPDLTPVPVPPSLFELAVTHLGQVAP